MKPVLVLLLLLVAFRVFSQGNAFSASELMDDGTYRPVKVWVGDSLIFVSVGTGLSNEDVSNTVPDAFIKLNPDNFVIQKAKIFEIYHSLKKNNEPGKTGSNGSIAILSIPSAFNKRERREFVLSADASEQSFIDLLLKRS